MSGMNEFIKQAIYKTGNIKGDTNIKICSNSIVIREIQIKNTKISRVFFFYHQIGKSLKV